MQKGDIQERSELHGQNLLFAASVVDAEDLVEILLVSCHIDAHGPAFPVDGQRIGFVQAAYQAPGIILIVIQFNEAGHSLNCLGPQGLGITIPLALRTPNKTEKRSKRQQG